MRIKTMIIIFITVLLTVVIMQNTEHVNFDFLFFTFRVSKLLMLLIVAMAAFLAGVMVGRPGRPKYIPGHVPGTDPDNKKVDTLSEEDRDYIS